jgi:hypothetical protein
MVASVSINNHSFYKTITFILFTVLKKGPIFLHTLAPAFFKSDAVVDINILVDVLDAPTAELQQGSVKSDLKFEFSELLIR